MIRPEQYLESRRHRRLPHPLPLPRARPHRARDRRPRRVRLTALPLPLPASPAGDRRGSSRLRRDERRASARERRDSPGARTRTSTSGREPATRRANWRPGVVERLRARPAAARPGRSVPQWIGMARRGRRMRRGLRRRAPGPCAPRRCVGPQPQTGSSATSSGPASSPIAGEQVGVAREVDRPRPAMTQPIAGPRRPERLAAARVVGVDDARSWTRSIVSRSPGSTSSTGPRPARLAKRPEPARDDDRRLARDPAQRRRVEVVVMAVADEHGVEVGEQLGQDRLRPGVAPGRSPRAGPGR